MLAERSGLFNSVPREVMKIIANLLEDANPSMALANSELYTIFSPLIWHEFIAGTPEMHSSSPAEKQVILEKSSKDANRYGGKLSDRIRVELRSKGPNDNTLVLTLSNILQTKVMATKTVKLPESLTITDKHRVIFTKDTREGAQGKYYLYLALGRSYKRILITERGRFNGYEKHHFDAANLALRRHRERYEFDTLLPRLHRLSFIAYLTSCLNVGVEEGQDIQAKLKQYDSKNLQALVKLHRAEPSLTLAVFQAQFKAIIPFLYRRLDLVGNRYRKEPYLTSLENMKTVTPEDVMLIDERVQELDIRQTAPS